MGFFTALGLFCEGALRTPDGFDLLHPLFDRGLRKVRTLLEFLQNSRSFILLLETLDRAINRFILSNHNTDQLNSPPQKAKQQHNFVLAINDWLKSIERIFDGYKYSEDEKIAETITQVHQASGFPKIPLAVVSGTKKMPFVPEKNFELHLQFQKELATLSSNSKHYTAEASGHFPQITEPEIVLAAIKDVIEFAKTA